MCLLAYITLRVEHPGLASKVNAVAEPLPHENSEALHCVARVGQASSDFISWLNSL